MKQLFLLSLTCCFATALTAQNNDAYQRDYATYLGGSDFEQARDLTIDKDGFIYIVGGTSSPNFPTTPGAYNTVYNSASGPTVGSWGPMMAFVSKFSPQGVLVWSTLLGGPNYDRAYAVEVDDSGYVYVGGRAGKDFPTTPGALQPVFTQSGAINNLYGHQNGFVSKLSPDGDSLIWSTYYGSDSYGFFRDIDIDENGYVYGVLNAVKVKPLGIPDDAWDTTQNGSYDVVVVKFNQTGTGVEWATFLGGSGDDQGGPSIQVGPDKSVYVDGSTKSTNFPTTPGAYQPQFNGNADMFVTRVAPDGKSLIYSTLFGGTGAETSETHSLFVDHLGQAYVACSTTSTDLPTTPGAIKPVKTGTDVDGLFFKLSADGSSLLACTYFGGTSSDSPEGLFVDSLQNLYVGGGTNSSGLPVTPNAFQSLKNGASDGFFIKINPDFSTPQYCTYFGGTNDESVRAFHVADDGTVCLSGQTISTNLPVTPDAFQLQHGSPNLSTKHDSYLAIFGLAASTPTLDIFKTGSTVHVFPNPAVNAVEIRSDDLQISQITVIDQLGRQLIFHGQMETQNCTIDVSNLTPGLYRAIIRLENQTLMYRSFVKT